MGRLILDIPEIYEDGWAAVTMGGEGGWRFTGMKRACTVFINGGLEQQDISRQRVTSRSIPDEITPLEPKTDFFFLSLFIRRFQKWPISHLTSLFGAMLFQHVSPGAWYHPLLTDVWTHGFKKRHRFHRNCTNQLSSRGWFKGSQEGDEGWCLFLMEVSGPTLKASLNIENLICTSAQMRSWVVCVASVFTNFYFFLMSRLLRGPRGSVTLPAWESSRTLCQLKPDVSWTPPCIFSTHVRRRKGRWQSLWSEWILY